jgi:hypothetical protein
LNPDKKYTTQSKLILSKLPFYFNGNWQLEFPQFVHNFRAMGMDTLQRGFLTPFFGSGLIRLSRCKA